ncbi:MAG: hypothetical protein KBT45_01795 [Bacteroidales bacterium]|nr:hypothetical protein [Candidatus Colimorpha pelethequi]
MQKLKVKQIEGVVSPAVSDDWTTLTEQLPTAAATNEKINKSLSNAINGVLQSVSNGSAESGKFVSAITKDGSAIKVTKAALPVTGVSTSNAMGSGTTTKAIVGITLSNGNIVATEKSIAFPSLPNIPDLNIDSVDFTSEISLAKVPFGGSVMVFVNGLMQPPADYTVCDGKLTFKDPSHFTKGDTVNVVYLVA